MRLSTFSKTGILFVFTLFIAACARSSAVNERVDLQVQKEPEVPQGTPAAVASRKVISESNQITPRQKTDLLAIHGKMAQDVAVIRGEMAKLQVILFKKVIEPDSPEDEIKNIRARLLNLDRKRTGRILSALDEVQRVLGVDPSRQERQPLFDALEPWKMM